MILRWNDGEHDIINVDGKHLQETAAAAIAALGFFYAVLRNNVKH